MTTPDTSAVRAWARENGYDVADRGRLPAEVTSAYLAANGRKKAPAKKAPARKAPVNIAAEQSAAGAAAEPKPAPTPTPPAEEETTARPKPPVVNDDRRLVALAEELAGLARRVEALEKAAAGKGSGGKTSRFRRRS